MSKFSAFRQMLVSAGVVAAALPEAPAVAASSGAAADGGAPGEEMITVVQAQAMTEAAMAASETKGFNAANERMFAVMTSDIGKAQPGAAANLLHKSPNMDAAACIATLEAIAPVAAAAPEAAAQPKVDLNLTPKPEIASAPAGGNGGGDEIDANSLWDGVQSTKNGQKSIVAGGISGGMGR